MDNTTALALTAGTRVIGYRYSKVVGEPTPVTKIHGNVVGYPQNATRPNGDRFVRVSFRGDDGEIYIFNAKNIEVAR